MTNKYTNELYEKIKESFSAKKGGYKNLLKTVPGNTYTVRIIPNVEDPTNTFFKYYLHGWNSPKDGHYVSTVCPTTYDEECPICAERFRLWNTGEDASKDLSSKLARKERYYINVYVVDDPVYPENNGTVKILGYGRQIATIIEEAMTEDEDEIGGRMMDFSKEGCNLRIKVEKNAAGYPNYSRSKFISKSPIDTTLEDIVDKIQEYDNLLNRKSADEMGTMLDEALYGIETTTTTTKPKAIETQAKVEKVEKDITDDIPMEFDMDSEDLMNEIKELG